MSADEVAEEAHAGRFSLPKRRLERAFKPVSAFVDDALVALDDEEIAIEGVDPAKVGLSEATIPVSECIEWDVQPRKFGINVSQVLDFCERTPGGKVIAAIGSDEDLLKLTCSNVTITVHLLDHKVIRTVEPPSAGLSSVELPQRDFRDAFVNLGEFAQKSVSIDLDENALTVTADSVEDIDQTLEYGFEVDRDDGSERARGLYSADYIKSLGEGVSASEGVVTIHIADEYPLQVETDDAMLAIAPRLEPDGEDQ